MSRSRVVLCVLCVPECAQISNVIHRLVSEGQRHGCVKTHGARAVNHHPIVKTNTLLDTKGVCPCQSLHPPCTARVAFPKHGYTLKAVIFDIDFLLDA
jgi:hypothetical protein